MRDPHPLAGKTVKVYGEHLFRVEDWAENVFGQPWGDNGGNPACIVYAVRSGLDGLPFDDEVVYGHSGGNGHLLHVSELGEEVAG